jgi:hypothetical protein
MLCREPRAAEQRQHKRSNASDDRGQLLRLLCGRGEHLHERNTLLSNGQISYIQRGAAMGEPAAMEKFTSGGSMLNLQPSTYLRLWEWREDKVNLIGARQSITVRIRYEKVLPSLTLGTDPVQIRSATDPLAFATAALAARSRGARALAQDLLATAQLATENLIERYVRPEQLKGRRRMPYSYHRRVIYL